MALSPSDMKLTDDEVAIVECIEKTIDKLLAAEPIIDELVVLYEPAFFEKIANELKNRRINAELVRRYKIAGWKKVELKVQNASVFSLREQPQ